MEVPNEYQLGQANVTETSTILDHHLELNTHFGPHIPLGHFVYEGVSNPNVFLGRPNAHGLLTSTSGSPTKSKPPDQTHSSAPMQTSHADRDVFMDANDHGISAGEESDMEVVEETPLLDRGVF